MLRVKYAFGKYFEYVGSVSFLFWTTTSHDYVLIYRADFFEDSSHTYNNVVKGSIFLVNSRTQYYYSNVTKYIQDLEKKRFSPPYIP